MKQHWPQAGDERIKDDAHRIGVKIVRPTWVEASYNNGNWVPEQPYALKISNGPVRGYSSVTWPKGRLFIAVVAPFARAS